MTVDNKDFKVKNGLVVQGSSATVAGNDVLTTASNIEDLANVDATELADGSILVYDLTLEAWVPGEPPASEASIFISDSAPSSPQEGDLWYNSLVGKTYIYYDSFWVESNPAGIGPAGPTGDTGPQGDPGPTYSISAETVTGGVNLRLTGSDASTDDVKIQGSGLVTITRTDADTITVDANLDLEFNQQSDSYTIVLSDKGKMVEVSSASENNLTIPLDSTTNFPIGSQINIMQTGSGQTTIVATSGVTLAGTPGLKLRAQWSAATLIKRAADSWVVVGDLSE